MKTLLIIVLLFNMNSYAQDTTYYKRHNDLYMTVRTQIDANTYKPHYNIKQRKKDNRFVAIVSAVFIGLTVWYFCPAK